MSVPCRRVGAARAMWHVSWSWYLCAVSEAHTCCAPALHLQIYRVRPEHHSLRQETVHVRDARPHWGGTGPRLRNVDGRTPKAFPDATMNLIRVAGFGLTSSWLAVALVLNQW